MHYVLQRSWILSVCNKDWYSNPFYFSVVVRDKFCDSFKNSVQNEYTWAKCISDTHAYSYTVSDFQCYAFEESIAHTDTNTISVDHSNNNGDGNGHGDSVADSFCFTDTISHSFAQSHAVKQRDPFANRFCLPNSLWVYLGKCNQDFVTIDDSKQNTFGYRNVVRHSDRF